MHKPKDNVIMGRFKGKTYLCFSLFHGESCTVYETNNPFHTLDLDDKVLVLNKSNSGTINEKFLGLCPFHEENTPSFIVSCDLDSPIYSEKSYTNASYHCVGCSAEGKVVALKLKHDIWPLFEETGYSQ